MFTSGISLLVSVLWDFLHKKKRSFFCNCKFLAMEKLHIEMTNIKVSDERTFRLLFDTFFPRSCVFAAQFMENKQTGEDVAQETFLAIWQAGGFFENIQAFKIYLYRALKHRCMTALKLQQQTVDVEPLKDSLPEESVIDHLIVEEEVKTLILQQINRLTGARRQIMLLRLEGKNFEEISRELNLSINTVKTHRKESYRQLRLGLSDCDKLAFMALLVIELLFK